MNPIKGIYNFIISFQIICMLIMIFYMIENNTDISFPIRIYIPLSNWLNIDYTFDFHFSYGTIIFILIALMAIYVLTSITVVGTGVSDTGTFSIKQFASFFSKYLLLNLPVIFIFSQSSFLSDYSFLISTIILIVYVINFLTDSGSEQNV